ncbi:hypothetical protein SUGI_0376600 [Cryptomeria japonica]|nr:hypothetical protein SUGI_0376600 [Cryptomeria japonica]
MPSTVGLLSTSLYYLGLALNELEGYLPDSTGGFSEANLVGNGAFKSVYRVCSNLDFKALILPYMSNGGLERWLYPPVRSGYRLNLHDRLRIIMDIAEAMAYLHHHCTVQVIHGDLKASNVLLGDDMTAYIADFGIAKILSSKSWDHLTSTNALQGSIGYIAPEYGMGQEISTNGDVYSFGILLLELLIRRRPVDEIFSEEVNLQKMVACLTALVQVGLDCTNQLPQQRPDMTEIIKRLHNIKGKYADATRDY